MGGGAILAKLKQTNLISSFHNITSAELPTVTEGGGTQKLTTYVHCNVSCKTVKCTQCNSVLLNF